MNNKAEKKKKELTQASGLRQIIDISNHLLCFDHKAGHSECNPFCIKNHLSNWDTRCRQKTIVKYNACSKILLSFDQKITNDSFRDALHEMFVFWPVLSTFIFHLHFSSCSRTRCKNVHLFYLDRLAGEFVKS